MALDKEKTYKRACPLCRGPIVLTAIDWDRIEIACPHCGERIPVRDLLAYRSPSRGTGNARIYCAVPESTMTTWRRAYQWQRDHEGIDVTWSAWLRGIITSHAREVLSRQP